MRIRILGGLELRAASGEPLHLPTRKTALILAALALAPRGLRREALCGLFWPDRAEAQARSSLRQALTALRGAFPETDPAIRIESNLETVRLIASAEAVDARQFEAVSVAGSPGALAVAATLYQGDLLDGIALPEPLDAWIAPHRQALRRDALLLVERLARLAGAATPEAGSACEALAQRLLAGDPAAEEAHRALMRLWLGAGRANAALRQFDLCREVLRRELQAEPEAETLALREGALGRSAPVAPPPAAPPAAPARDQAQPGIIVMPFDNLSGAADEYFVDGVVEEITGALSRVREFFVIARQSAFTYKGRFVDVREVGRELGVSYVVEGTVRRGGDRLRISVQLVDAATRAQLWSDRYEGAATDVFDFQDRIAAQVAGAIQPAVRNAEIAIAARKPTGSLQAHDLLLRAYPRIWSHEAADNAEAIALLGAALAADPRYGRAHALSAWCHSQDVVYLWSTDPEASREAAREAVETAAGLIADDPIALAAVGAAISQCLGDLPRAGALIETALALDPNNAWAWARYAWLAIYEEVPDAAIPRFERSLALSPLDPLAFNLRIGIASALSHRGDYAEAVRRLQAVLSRHPKVTWAYRIMAYSAALGGDMPTARAAVAKLLAANPHASIALMRRSHPSRGRAAFARMVEGWRLAGLPEG
ncbi:BTAD domain-containing putative transcriptional regulator [Roseomonas sp. AR75]|uniref:BTAD domain-containing putative transcriptional regulator n=1 Tax=Roseomonas sp. AR75 TaxID=2562311 RepID=UPI0010BFFD82|nr:BTAD domain-containing putative transcriptional regulator [Roseomonas sp. AR75]